jgi:hypothetical protein
LLERLNSFLMRLPNDQPCWQGSAQVLQVLQVWTVGHGGGQAGLQVTTGVQH